VSAQTHQEVGGPCRNCGATFPVQDPSPRYCPQCGQETALHPPSLGEFLHEFIGHYVALEGALWKTLALLLFRPGQLTREYFAGRRRRYVLPLRVYLSASFLFFLCVKLLPSEGPPPGVEVPPPVATAPNPGVVVRDETDGTLDACLAAGAQCSAIETRFARAVNRWENDPQAIQHFKGRFVSAVPYAVFLMLPLFSAVVMLAYKGRRLRYGEHFVFALHIHSFWFLALLALWLAPEGYGVLGLLVLPAYSLLALRRVYDGGWWPTLARGLFITLAYGLLLLAATLLLLGLLFVFG